MYAAPKMSRDMGVADLLAGAILKRYEKNLVAFEERLRSCITCMWLVGLSHAAFTHFYVWSNDISDLYLRSISTFPHHPPLNVPARMVTAVGAFCVCSKESHWTHPQYPHAHAIMLLPAMPSLPQDPRFSRLQTPCQTPMRLCHVSPGSTSRHEQRAKVEQVRVTSDRGRRGRTAQIGERMLEVRVAHPKPLEQRHPLRRPGWPRHRRAAGSGAGRS